MDGNRRWASARGLSTLEGHKAGFKKLKEVAGWAKDSGIEVIIFYAFSTENWKRTPNEVSYLIGMFESALQNELDELKGRNVRVKFIGDRSRFSQNIQTLMVKMESETKHATSGTLVIAVSYGGRAEIVTAANALRNSDAPITEESFQKHLATSDIPDPDVVLRTGGEQRLSNFLPWQITYSELFFSNTLWPDYSKAEFDQLLADFETRRRNFGK